MCLSINASVCLIVSLFLILSPPCVSLLPPFYFSSARWQDGTLRYIIYKNNTLFCNNYLKIFLIPLLYFNVPKLIKKKTENKWQHKPMIFIRFLYPLKNNNNKDNKDERFASTFPNMHTKAESQWTTSIALDVKDIFRYKNNLQLGCARCRKEDYSKKLHAS